MRRETLKCGFAFGKVGQRSCRNGDRVWSRGAWKQTESAALFVASCGAIRGPSAHNRLCLKGIHSLAPRPSSQRLCTEEHTTHFHAPFYLFANRNSACRSSLSASFRQFEQHIFVFRSCKRNRTAPQFIEAPQAAIRYGTIMNLPWHESSPVYQSYQKVICPHMLDETQLHVKIKAGAEKQLAGPTT